MHQFFRWGNCLPCCQGLCHSIGNTYLQFSMDHHGSMTSLQDYINRRNSSRNSGRPSSRPTSPIKWIPSFAPLTQPHGPLVPRAPSRSTNYSRPTTPPDTAKEDLADVTFEDSDDFKDS